LFPAWRLFSQFQQSPKGTGSGNGNGSGHGNGTFRLHMAFGLHAGWAIEGAVGSPHKIDATYLSPHVNLAAR
jgi:class 3 adenylate cyclase